MILIFIMGHNYTLTQPLMFMAGSPPGMNTMVNTTIRRFMVSITTTTQRFTMVTRFTAMSIYIMKILTCTSNLLSPKWPTIMQSQLTLYRKPMWCSQPMSFSQLVWFNKRLLSSL